MKETKRKYGYIYLQLLIPLRLTPSVCCVIKLQRTIPWFQAKLQRHLYT